MSTITSQFIDTIVFILLAFFILPLLFSNEDGLSSAQIISMIIGQIIIKWGLALLDTPLIYLLKWIVGEEVEGAHDS